MTERARGSARPIRVRRTRAEFAFGSHLAADAGGNINSHSFKRDLMSSIKPGRKSAIVQSWTFAGDHAAETDFREEFWEVLRFGRPAPSNTHETFAH